MDLPPQVLEGQTTSRKQLRRETAALAYQPQQHVLGPDVVVMQLQGFAQ